MSDRESEREEWARRYVAEICRLSEQFWLDLAALAAEHGRDELAAAIRATVPERSET